MFCVCVCCVLRVVRCVLRVRSYRCRLGGRRPGRVLAAASTTARASAAALASSAAALAFAAAFSSSAGDSETETELDQFNDARTVDEFSGSETNTECDFTDSEGRPNPFHKELEVPSILIEPGFFLGILMFADNCWILSNDFEFF